MGECRLSAGYLANDPRLTGDLQPCFHRLSQCIIVFDQQCLEHSASVQSTLSDSVSIVKHPGAGKQKPEGYETPLRV
jgi:hypothetical protein